MKKIPIILLLCCTCFAYESSTGSGGFPGEYLISFGSNAKVLGLSGASCLNNKSASLSYYNPAGIAFLVNKEVTLFYSPLYAGASFSHICIGYPVAGGSVVGVSRTAIDINGIDKTDENGAINGSSNSNESAYFISYGYMLSDKYSLGINLKVISSSMDLFSTTGYGVDIGFDGKLLPFLEFGLTIQNILQPQIKLRTETDKYPTNIRLSACYTAVLDRVYVYADGLLMNVLPDNSLYLNGYKTSIRWFGGVEFMPLDQVSLRGGINYKEITGGFGYKTNDFDIDYSAGFHELGITHKMSLTLRFGLLLSESEKWIKEKEKEVDFKTYYSRAVKLYNEKKFDEAKIELKGALAVLPDNKEAKDLANSIDSEIRISEARKVFENGIEDYEAGKESEAKEKLEQARKVDPEITVKMENEYLTKAQQMVSDRNYVESKRLIARVLFINADNKQAQELFKKLNSLLEMIK
jgi:tetratricopeptide (TPR) repeat protein